MSGIIRTIKSESEMDEYKVGDFYLIDEAPLANETELVRNFNSILYLGEDGYEYFGPRLGWQVFSMGENMVKVYDGAHWIDQPPNKDLEMDVGKLKQDLLDELRIRVEETDRLLRITREIEKSLDDAYARIKEEIEVRVSENEAQARRTTELEASIGDARSSIIKEQIARVTRDSALATDIVELDVKLTEDIRSNIRIEREARVTQDEALARGLESYRVEMRGNYAQIQQTFETKINPALNELYAQWAIELDVNGNVAGLKFLNDGKKSDFTIRTDSFNIYNPKTGSKEPAFYVENGDTFVNGSLRSGNYRPGVSGFNMDSKTGDAEFNNVTIRGNLDYSNILVGGQNPSETRNIPGNNTLQQWYRPGNGAYVNPSIKVYDYTYDPGGLILNSGVMTFNAFFDLDMYIDSYTMGSTTISGREGENTTVSAGYINIFLMITTQAVQNNRIIGKKTERMLALSAAGRSPSRSFSDTFSLSTDLNMPLQGNSSSVRITTYVSTKVEISGGFAVNPKTNKYIRTKNTNGIINLRRI